MFQCRTRLCLWCKRELPQRRKRVPVRFNAARGFVCGARCQLHAASVELSVFQCRTRLCLWCKISTISECNRCSRFQCRTRLCLWCKSDGLRDNILRDSFNAARGFVCGARFHELLCYINRYRFQCRTRLCLWCKVTKDEGGGTTIIGFNAARGFVCGARYVVV